MSEHTNRLADETSLYLKQHANNPVDWYPWGPEALTKAEELNRPIFLSIGYSACHWCHVMEHECFENADIAEVMNRHYINIKVDREERPDLDQLYMTSLQLLTQEGGGWPLSVFLAPNLTPFYAGTYFPPDDRYMPQRPSFPRILSAIADAWAKKQDELLELGQNVANALQSINDTEVTDSPLSEQLLRQAYQALKRNYEPNHGGFGTAPKFPHAVDLRVLLRLADRGMSRPETMSMVCHTLNKMARGGMYDQIGGGFHRYSVDEKWLVPHFEKMLYDNALLPLAYIEGYQATGDPFYRHVVSQTLDYVLREMTCEAGGFYSTQDADSEGVEGKFYVWSEAEIDQVLGPDLAPLAKSVYGVTGAGNFEGQNILFRSKSDEQDARLHNLTVDELRQKLSQIQCKLYGTRSERVWPGRDEKILTAWNGLMISAFARAGAAFNEPKYIEAAVKAAEFVQSRLRKPDGRLYRTCGADAPAKLEAYLEDYAYTLEGLVDLYQASFDPRWLGTATELADLMIDHYGDPDKGGFYFTADDHEQLMARSKDHQDGSTPSGNAVAATALQRLAVLTGRTGYAEVAKRTIEAYGGLLADHPAAAGQMLLALDWQLGPAEELALVGLKGQPETEAVLAKIRSSYRPRSVLAFRDTADDSNPEDVPLLAGKAAVDGQVSLYICQHFQCEAPLVGSEAIMARFAEKIEG